MKHSLGDSSALKDVEYPSALTDLIWLVKNWKGWQVRGFSKGIPRWGPRRGLRDARLETLDLSTPSEDG